MSIRENIEIIKKDIPKNVIIIAATKKRSMDDINELIDSGIGVIGENYVQEAENKSKTLDKDVEMHCIGHLQSNKVKKAVEIFDMVQTVDSKKIAKEIDKRCADIGKVMPVLIELNIGNEVGKKGCMLSKVNELASFISGLNNLNLKGIMTMGPNLDAKGLRPYFKRAKEVFDTLINQGYDLDTLSMGMSNSYKVAIEEGATMIRLGNVIFCLRK